MRLRAESARSPYSWHDTLGMTPVTYGPGLVDRVRALAPQGVDVTLDCIGGEAVPVSLELVSDRNRIGTIADYTAVEKYGVRRPGGDRSAQNLTELVELHTAGRLELPIHLAAHLEDDHAVTGQLPHVRHAATDQLVRCPGGYSVGRISVPVFWPVMKACLL